jgi:hypothetical protein
LICQRACSGVEFAALEQDPNHDATKADQAQQRRQRERHHRAERAQQRAPHQPPFTCGGVPGQPGKRGVISARLGASAKRRVELATHKQIKHLNDKMTR